MRSIPIMLGFAAALVTAGYAAARGMWLLAGVALLAAAMLARAAWQRPREPLRAPQKSPAPADAERASGAPLDAIEGAAVLIDDGQKVRAANNEAFDLLGRGIIGEDIRVALRHPAALEAIGAARSEDAAQKRDLTGIGRGAATYRLRAVPAGTGELLVTLADISAALSAERMRAEFVANASHELRTPLATLVGFIETLQGPAAEDADARTRFLGVMAGESARMTRLIDDLLSLSRIERDKNVRPQRIVDLGKLVGEFAKNARLGANGKSEVRLEIGEGDMRVPADRDQILQVLHNLFSNAVKYGAADAPVDIVLTRTQEAVSISVRDHGEGIAAEHIPRLTERFYRVDAGRSQRLGGTGLGLAIVKHIVERHRGRLKIESSPGEGTAAQIVLPAATVIKP